jgi:hypothetical protein
MAKKVERARDALGRYMAGEGKPIANGRSKPSARWSREKEAIFFRELAMICNVRSALKAAGLARESRQVYERRKLDPDFRIAWEEAIDQSYAMLELEMLERARFGDARPAAETEAEKRLRAIPDGLALQLLKLHQNRVKARVADGVKRRGAPGRAVLRGPALRREIHRRLSELNLQMGGEG